MEPELQRTGSLFWVMELQGTGSHFRVLEPELQRTGSHFWVMELQGTGSHFRVLELEQPVPSLAHNAFYIIFLSF